MLGKFSLFLGLLAICNASSIPAKRAATNKVTDGSFEAVPFNCMYVFDETCGNWTVSGRAAFAQDSRETPYGTNFTTFFAYKPRDHLGAVSQEIEGLSTGTYTLSYAYSHYDNYKPGPCNFTVTYGSQLLDTVK